MGEWQGVEWRVEVGERAAPINSEREEPREYGVYNTSLNCSLVSGAQLARRSTESRLVICPKSMAPCTCDRAASLYQAMRGTAALKSRTALHQGQIG